MARGDRFLPRGVKAGLLGSSGAAWAEAGVAMTCADLSVWLHGLQVVFSCARVGLVPVICPEPSGSGVGTQRAVRF